MNTKLSKSKKIKIIILAAVVALLMMTLTIYYIAVDEMTYVNSSTSSAMSVIENKYMLMNSMADMTEELAERDRYGSSYLNKVVFKNTDSVKEALNVISTDTVKSFFITADGQVIKCKDAGSLDLSHAQISELKKEGVLVTNNADGDDASENNAEKTNKRKDTILYEGFKINKGFLITKEKNYFSEKESDVMAGLSKEYLYYIADKKDGKIISAAPKSLIGQKLSDRIHTPKLKIDKKLIKKNNSDKFGFLELGDQQVFSRQNELNKVTIGVAYPCTKIFKYVFYRCIPVFIVLVGILATLLIFLFRLKSSSEKYTKKKEDIELSEEGSFSKKLFCGKNFRKKSTGEKSYEKKSSCGKVCVDKSILYILTGMLLLSTVIFILFNVHYSGFLSFSLQNSLSSRNMELLSDNLDICKKDKNSSLKLLTSSLSKDAQIINNLMSVNPAWGSHEQLKNLSDNCDIEEISVYNGKGMIEKSSGDYIGYRLTNDKNDSRYIARKLLSTDANRVFQIFKDGSNRYMFAQKRKSQPGIVCIIYNDPAFDTVMDCCSNKEAIRTTDFGNATVFYINIKNDSATYMIKPHSKIITVTTQKLPKVLHQNNYSGICNIQGEDSYVCTKKSNGLIIVSSIKCQYSFTDGIQYVLCSLLFAALIMLILLYGCISVRSDSPETDNPETDNTETDNPEKEFYEQVLEESVSAGGVEPSEKTSICKSIKANSQGVLKQIALKEETSKEETSEEEEISLEQDTETVSEFRKNLFIRMFKIILIIVLIGYISILFGQSKDDTTLLYNLFYGKWEKGLNIFAVNVSVIYGATILVIAYLLKKALVFIGKNTGQKAMTVCNISASLMQFAALILIVGFAMYQFGVNASAILAGAGIAGVVLGIAAKHIFEDLFAGLFLIFEGNIHVGDFVSFNDFRGEIVEIGTRVSVVQRYNRKLIINNSELRQYYRLSDLLAAAWVEVTIGANEDVYAVKELILNSEEWYRSSNEDLQEGPFFCDVSDFNSSGITICLYGLCPDARNPSCTRKLKLQTLELFREHGISLGKNLVKLEITEEEKQRYIEEALMQKNSR